MCVVPIERHMERRTGPQDTESLRQIYEEMQAGMTSLAAAIRMLESIPENHPDTIHVLGSRGIFGTAKDPGVLPKFHSFAEDAKRKANLLVREIRRKRRG